MGNCQAQVLNSNFHMSGWILSLATNTITCFLSSDSFTSFIFERVSARCSSLKAIVFECQSFLLVKTVFLVKNGCQWLFLKRTMALNETLCSDMQQNCFMYTFHFTIQNIINYTQRLWFNKIANFYFFIKDIL